GDRERSEGAPALPGHETGNAAEGSSNALESRVADDQGQAAAPRNTERRPSKPRRDTVATPSAQDKPAVDAAAEDAVATLRDVDHDVADAHAQARQAHVQQAYATDVTRNETPITPNPVTSPHAEAPATPHREARAAPTVETP